MNRKERRARRVRGTRPIGRLRFGNGTPIAAAQCPDCAAEVEEIDVIVGPSGVRHHQIEVRHDDTCPWYAELQRNLS
jgi:hypothetical protein